MAQRHRCQGPFDRDYDVPFTTIHVGTIKGGTALHRAEDLRIRIRVPLPAVRRSRDIACRSAGVRAEIPPGNARSLGRHRNRFEEMSELPGFDTGSDSTIAELGRCCNQGTQFNKVSFGAEASLFHNAGIPTILCGPGHIAQAHQPNEWVSIEQVARCETFMRRLLDRCSSVPA
jgi:acetylornithine deacetylase